MENVFILYEKIVIIVIIFLRVFIIVIVIAFLNKPYLTINDAQQYTFRKSLVKIHIIFRFTGCFSRAS